MAGEDFQCPGCSSAEDVATQCVVEEETVYYCGYCRMYFRNQRECNIDGEYRDVK